MKRLSLSLVAALLCSPFLNSVPDVISETLFDEENLSYDKEETEEEATIHCPIDIESPFADNRVLVTLKAVKSNPEGLCDEYISSLFEGVDYIDIDDLSKVRLNDALKEYYAKHPFHQIYCLKLPTNSKRNVIKVCETLENLEDVLAASPDYYSGCSSWTPTDPDYTNGKQWGLYGAYGIDAPTAWNTTKGNGQTVTVGIIDSGIYDHEDLNNNLVPGWDFYNNNGTTNDGVSDHGTHVAGIVAACANSTGIVGVAPNVKICPLQVESPFNWEGEHAMFWSNQIQAINYATGFWGTTSQISVLSRSIGFQWSVFKSSFFDKYLLVSNAIGNFPGLFVESAGNETTNIDDGRYVSTFSKPNVIVVGAINKVGERAYFSNYGNAVNIYAPGVDIWSTIKDTYGYKDGTSMATPFVSGVAALLYSMNPGLTASQVKQAILEGAHDTSIIGGDGIRYYTKRLSASGAVNYAKSHFIKEKAPLRLGFVNQVNGDTWKVRIQNPNDFLVYAAYNKKTCNENDAKGFTGLYDVDVVKIPANSSKTVEISKNGWASWYAAAYGYEKDGKRYLKVSCTNDTRQLMNLLVLTNPVYSAELDYSSRMGGNSQNNSGVVGSIFDDYRFPTLNAEPSALGIKIVQTPNWFSNGRAVITNPNNYKVYCRFRSILCFEGDAKIMIKSDTIGKDIPKNTSISHNFGSNWGADYFAASIDYYYHGFFYSVVSYIKSDTSSQTKENVMMWF